MIAQTKHVEYEGTKPRLIKGDVLLLDMICKELDSQARIDDGYLKYGENKSTYSDAIHLALITYFNEEYKLPEIRLDEGDIQLITRLRLELSDGKGAVTHLDAIRRALEWYFRIDMRVQRRIMGDL